MKVFFTTAPRFKKTFSENIKKIYQMLADLGYSHVDDYILKVKQEEFYTLGEDNVPEYYERIMEAIRKADIIVFETSFPSTGVGHLLDTSLYLGKRVIALHLKNHFPFMLGGIKNDRLVIVEYSLETLKNSLESATEYISEKSDVRFNFFISPEIQQYLDWMAKYKRTPRAVHLRELLEKDMRENKDWKKQK